MHFGCRQVSHTVNTHIVGGDKPGHLGARGELAIDKALDLAFGPSVVDVHYRYRIPPAKRIKYVIPIYRLSSQEKKS